MSDELSTGKKIRRIVGITVILIIFYHIASGRAMRRR